MQPWSFKLALEGVDEREVDRQNQMITAAFKGVQIEFAKQRKRLDHYLIQTKSARAQKARKSGQQKWSDVRSIFGA